VSGWVVVGVGRGVERVVRFAEIRNGVAAVTTDPRRRVMTTYCTPRLILVTLYEF